MSADKRVSPRQNREETHSGNMAAADTPRATLTRFAFVRSSAPAEHLTPKRKRIPALPS